jgi:hypothetical protein
VHQAGADCTLTSPKPHIWKSLEASSGKQLLIIFLFSTTVVFEEQRFNIARAAASLC